MYVLQHNTNYRRIKYVGRWTATATHNIPMRHRTAPGHIELLSCKQKHKWRYGMNEKWMHKSSVIIKTLFKSHKRFLLLGRMFKRLQNSRFHTVFLWFNRNHSKVSSVLSSSLLIECANVAIRIALSAKRPLLRPSINHHVFPFNF